MILRNGCARRVRGRFFRFLATVVGVFVIGEGACGLQGIRNLLKGGTKIIPLLIVYP